MPPDPPVQKPRIPIWVVGAWGRPRSMSRALRYDGLLPHTGKLDPRVVAEMRAYADRERGPGAGPCDIVVEDVTPAGVPRAGAEIVQPYAEAGATWWIESPWEYGDDYQAVLARVHAGPPRPD